MIGTITLDALQFYAYHGVSEMERRVGNKYVVRCSFELNVGRAAQSDLIDDTISYADVYDLIAKEMSISSKLIEHVAGRTIKALLASFPSLLSVELTVTKCSPPITGSIGSASITLKKSRC